MSCCCQLCTSKRLCVVVGVVVAGDGALVAIRSGVAQDVQRVRVVHEGAQCRPHICHLQSTYHVVITCSLSATR